MEEIYGFVKNIVVYLILVTIIMNLVGKSSYRKYVSVFVGMLLILIVIKPVLRFFNLTDSYDYYFSSNQFSVDAKSYKDDLLAADEAGQVAILAEYRNIIDSQIENMLSRYNLYPSDIQVTLDEEAGSSNYGSVTKVSISAAFTIDDSLDHNADEPDAVEKVEVNPIMINEDIDLDEEQNEPENGSDQSKLALETVEKLKDDIANSFNLSEDNIYVTILP
ncbi:MAG TPA: stage III sporulation protein AF [Lachnospiraceae bacterium]|nr:stage III sporulation protein AF [Lachnospiraceae bacterium]